MTTEVTFIANGEERTVRVEPRTLLLDALRDGLDLHGAHAGCEHGVCGACTIILDGEPVRSCLMLAIQAEGVKIETIEGLESETGELHPLQAAFGKLHGLQCGFCTPGMFLSSLALLRENPRPTEREIREALAGNICRCTGYVNIVQSVSTAAELLSR